MQSLAGKLEDTNRRLSQLSQQIAEAQAAIGFERRDAARRRARAAGGSPGAPVAAGAARAGRPVVRRRRRGAAGPRRPTSTTRRRRTTSAAATTSRARASRTTPRPSRDGPLRRRPLLGRRVLVGPEEAARGDRRLDRLFRTYPQSDKAPAAHLKKGLAHLELGEKAQAIVQLQYVVHEFPASDEAKSARQRLKALGCDRAGKPPPARQAITTPERNHGQHQAGQEARRSEREARAETAPS